MHRRTPLAFAALASSLLVLQPSTAAWAADCTPRMQQEINLINQRAASADSTNDTAALCRGIADQIRSYEFIIGSVQEPRVPRQRSGGRHRADEREGSGAARGLHEILQPLRGPRGPSAPEPGKARRRSSP